MDNPADREVGSTSLPVSQEADQGPSSATLGQGPTTNGTQVGVNEGDGSHYFPGVPESLDEAPER